MASYNDDNNIDKLNNLFPSSEDYTQFLSERLDQAEEIVSQFGTSIAQYEMEGKPADAKAVASTWVGARAQLTNLDNEVDAEAQTFYNALQDEDLTEVERLNNVRSRFQALQGKAVRYSSNSPKDTGVEIQREAYELAKTRDDVNEAIFDTSGLDTSDEALDEFIESSNWT